MQTPYSFESITVSPFFKYHSYSFAYLYHSAFKRTVPGWILACSLRINKLFRIKRDTHCSDQFTDFLLNYVISFWDLNIARMKESFGAQTVQRKKETWIFLTKEKRYLISKRKCNIRVCFENIDVLSFQGVFF